MALGKRANSEAVSFLDDARASVVGLLNLFMVSAAARRDVTEVDQSAASRRLPPYAGKPNDLSKACASAMNDHIAG